MTVEEARRRLEGARGELSEVRAVDSIAKELDNLDRALSDDLNARDAEKFFRFAMNEIGGFLQAVSRNFGADEYDDPRLARRVISEIQRVAATLERV